MAMDVANGTRLYETDNLDKSDAKCVREAQVFCARALARDSRR